MSKISEKEMRQLLKVYFIMGSNNCVKDPIEVVKEALEGGVTLFQFREKGEGAFTGEDKVTFAKELQRICQTNNVPFIVNDDIELALELNADGVHIGQEDETAKIVREKIGDDKIVGVSVHNLEEAKKAIAEGADYVGVGPIFPTTTKEDAKEVQGTTLIQSLVENNLHIPIVGIGGITSENAGDVMKAGADGVSVITAISMAESPLESARELVKSVISSNVE